MISRTRIRCLTCKNPITARIQIGHEIEQPVNFPCPHCGTLVQLTLILDDPPKVKVRWDENAEPGQGEGAIVNIGAGFTVAQNKLHQDFYFPSFDAPRPRPENIRLPEGVQGPILLDAAIALGTLPHAQTAWRTLERALRFHRTGQTQNLNTQLADFWGGQPNSKQTLDNALFGFLTRFLAPNSLTWLRPLGTTLHAAHTANPGEYAKLVSYYDAELKVERFEAYAEIIAEYFRGYGDFSQTLVYVRRDLALPANAVATSSDFDRTRMFYGNAFEVLGSHLDLPAALNNILSGRTFDQMNTMSLKKFRTIHKASRTNCFAGNPELSWLVAEYDSAVRNASHHRWFRLDDSRRNISFRSGGTGALHRMSYAEYLLRCNRLTIQIMMLICLELVLLSTAGKSL